MPVQSDSIPLINIYFTLCMGFSLSAMIWFSFTNLLKENKKVPKSCRNLVVNYICYLMCINNFKTKKSSNKNLIDVEENKKYLDDLKSISYLF